MPRIILALILLLLLVAVPAYAGPSDRPCTGDPFFQSLYADLDSYDEDLSLDTRNMLADLGCIAYRNPGGRGYGSVVCDDDFACYKRNPDPLPPPPSTTTVWRWPPAPDPPTRQAQAPPTRQVDAPPPPSTPASQRLYASDPYDQGEYFCTCERPTMALGEAQTCVVTGDLRGSLIWTTDGSISSDNLLDTRSIVIQAMREGPGNVLQRGMLCQTIYVEPFRIRTSTPSGRRRYRSRGTGSRRIQSEPG